MVVKLHTTIVFIFVVILFDYCCHFDNCYWWWLSKFILQFWVVPLVNLMQSSAVLCVAVLKLYSFSVAVCDSMWQYVTVYSSCNVLRLWWQLNQYIQFWTQAITAVYGKTTLQIDSVAAVVILDERKLQKLVVKLS